MNRVLKDLRVHHGKLLLVQETLLEIPARGLVLVDGENGAGKSSLLSELARRLIGEKFFLRKEVGFVSALGLYERSLPLFGIEFSKLYFDSEWPTFWEQKFGYLKAKRLDVLSSGEFQALVLISNLLRSTKVLFLDEPFSHLSREWSLIFRDEIERRSEEQLIFLVSHQQGLGITKLARHFEIKNGLLRCLSVLRGEL